MDTYTNISTINKYIDVLKAISHGFMDRSNPWRHEKQAQFSSMVYFKSTSLTFKAQINSMINFLQRNYKIHYTQVFILGLFIP